VDQVDRLPRRALLLSATLTLLSGCSTVSILSSTSTPRDPRETLDAFFSFLATSRYDDAKRMMTPSFQARLGSEGVDALLHSIHSAHITDVIDAVTWANQLGAQLPAPPPDRREFLVTLEVTPSSEGQRSWSVGTNRRFIDLSKRRGAWEIDGIAVSPGPLITGRTEQTSNQTTVVLPISALRLGPAPVNRALYAARQSAVERGAIPWATDPVEVIHHDGPSFGLNPSDPVKVIRQDRDPTSLVPRTFAVVHQGGKAYLVTLIQPIRTGSGGIWAISEVEAYGTFAP